MGYRRHYAILLDRKGNVIKERSNNDGDTRHAEMRVLRNSNRKDYIGGTIVIVRQVLKNNSEVCGSMSKPCNKCMNVIKPIKLNKIVYSTGDENEPWKKIML